MFKLFTKTVTIIEPYDVPTFIIFNVNNFNIWFNDTENRAVYAHSGIFLRVDKLSQSHVYDYLLKCYGIENNYEAHLKYGIELTDFISEIRFDWLQKISNNYIQHKHRHNTATNILSNDNK